MIEIDIAFVESASPNAAAIANGRGLIVKGKFVGLHQSDDKSVIFGECRGSGASNYICSCDFIEPAKPVYRCTCPSRQFPCKHSIGLMLAWVDGKTFKVSAVPEDILSKREKIEKRVEKKKEDNEKPIKVNKSALAKKIKAQLDGLDLLEQLTLDLVRTGMGNTSAKTASQIEEQAKQLGNAFLPGAQSALYSYTKLFSSDEGRVESEVNSKKRELIYSRALDQLTRLNALVKQGRKYLQARLEDPELAPETDSAIAAWLGHAWQLRELRDAGLVQNDAELIQLAFNAYDDIARREFVETGIWMNLADGKICLTQNFRPYKAAKMIKSEDSFFKIAKIPELCIYPGDMNRRVRWDGMTSRSIEAADLQRVRKHAVNDLSVLIKEIKQHLKSPLADRHPVVAFHFSKIGQVDDQTLVVEDHQGNRLAFTETGASEEPASCHLLWLIPKSMLAGQVLVARFHHDLDTGSLRVKPLSIVTESQVFRLTL